MIPPDHNTHRTVIHLGCMFFSTIIRGNSMLQMWPAIVPIVIEYTKNHIFRYFPVLNPIWGEESENTVSLELLSGFYKVGFLSCVNTNFLLHFHILRKKLHNFCGKHYSWKSFVLLLQVDNSVLNTQKWHSQICLGVGSDSQNIEYV